jgi:hypothetical protein
MAGVVGVRIQEDMGGECQCHRREDVVVVSRGWKGQYKGYVLFYIRSYFVWAVPPVHSTWVVRGDIDQIRTSDWLILRLVYRNP